jgi:hypothetical protein
MPASTDIREGVGEAFDALSDEFLVGVTIKLCSQTAGADTFTDLLTVTSKRFFEYSNFRKNFLLEIADDSSTLTTAMAAATHVKIGTEVYIIIAGDTVAPMATDPTWKIYVDRFERPAHWSPLG